MEKRSPAFARRVGSAFQKGLRLATLSAPSHRPPLLPPGASRAWLRAHDSHSLLLSHQSPWPFLPLLLKL